jgi:CBS domain-containing protein
VPDDHGGIDRSSDVVAAWMHMPVQVVDVDDQVGAVRSLTLSEGFQHAVVQENGHIVGVISDHEVMRSVSPRVDSPLATPGELAMLGRHVHQMMGRSPVTVTPDAPLRDAAGLLLANRVHCLPVIDAGRCVGILTTSDVMRWAVTLAGDRVAELVNGGGR